MVAAEIDGFLTGTMKPGSFLMRGTGGFYIFGLVDLAILGTRAKLNGHGLAELRGELKANPSPLHLIHRIVSALAGVLAVLVVMRTCHREFGPRVALLAGAMLAVSYLQVRVAHMGTVDSMWALFTLLTVDRVLLVARSGKRLNYIQAGLLAGATTAMKYFGVFLGLHLIVGHLAARRSQVPSPKSQESGVVAPQAPWRYLVLSLGLCPLGFFLFSTFLAVDWRDLLDTAKVQVGTIGAGPSLTTALNVLISHGRTTFMAGLGWPVFVLAAIGMLAGLVRHGTPRLISILILLAAPSLVITNISPIRFGTAHALLMVIPAALALEGLLRVMPRRSAPWIAVLVLVPSVANSICFNRILKQEDTRSEMLTAMDALGVENSDIVGVGLYGLPRRHMGIDTPYVNLAKSIEKGASLTPDSILADPPRYFLYDTTSSEWDTSVWELLAPLVASRYRERLRIAPSADSTAAKSVARACGSPAFMVPFVHPCAVDRPGPTLILYERIDS